MSIDDLSPLLGRFAADRTAGVSCGKGWHDILVELDRQLAAACPDVRYRDIKEKFGELRVYTTQDGDPDVRALIRAAEEKAAVTCEECGQPGALNDGFDWIRTLCPRCADARAEHYAAQWRERASNPVTTWPMVQMRWGSGWPRILAELRHDLRKIDPQLCVIKVWQRQGVLQVSFWPSAPELREPVRKRIESASAASEVTCERCGQPGRLQDRDPDGWSLVNALCDPCTEFRTVENRQHGFARPVTVRSLHGRIPARLAQDDLVLMENEDGSLAELAYRSEPNAVQAVENNGALSWHTPEAAAQAEGRPVGAAIPALILRRMQGRRGAQRTP